ncbi:hypothetical protein GC722_16100 [Auraticoccus sp. F435]|uniref:UspA domain-containing protein n=1 Tax=Auraticoccus cholistanensis TaxID=2656650 RepID=A0A6A9V1P7_9ACTN|nr:universal stress protein [Auraticoccus cholistanensis]MVA77526.1 hypothetical protein [Auraticoccus cholistanensis]
MSVQDESGAGAPDRPYTVVVGVSATSGSPTALVWGAAQARQNGGRLVAVRAWRMPSPPPTTSGGIGSRVQRESAVEQNALEILRRDVAAVLGEDHQAEVRLVRGSSQSVLLAAAQDADLLVIDAPRAMTGAPLFAQRIVYAASCPVVVMPPAISGQRPSAVQRAGRAVGRAALRSVAMAGRPGYRPPMPPPSAQP